MNSFTILYAEDEIETRKNYSKLFKKKFQRSLCCRKW